MLIPFTTMHQQNKVLRMLDENKAVLPYLVHSTHFGPVHFLPPLHTVDTIITK